MGRQPAGGAVATDRKETAPNEKAGADTRALAWLPLLGSDITDKKGSALKENPFAAVADPAK